MSSPFSSGSRSIPGHSMLSSLLQTRRSSNNDNLPPTVAVEVDDAPDRQEPAYSLFGSVAAALSTSNFDSRMLSTSNFHFVSKDQALDQVCWTTRRTYETMRSTVRSLWWPKQVGLHQLQVCGAACAG